MLHHVLQLVSNFVFLLFGAEQIVHCGFLEIFCWKKADVGNEVDDRGETEEQL